MDDIRTNVCVLLQLQHFPRFLTLLDGEFTCFEIALKKVEKNTSHVSAFIQRSFTFYIPCSAVVLATLIRVHVAIFMCVR